MDLAAQLGWVAVEDAIAADDALVDEVERSGLDYLDSPGEWLFGARLWGVADAIDLSGGDPDEVPLSAWREYVEAAAAGAFTTPVDAIARLEREGYDDEQIADLVAGGAL